MNMTSNRDGSFKQKRGPLSPNDPGFQFKIPVQESGQIDKPSKNMDINFDATSHQGPRSPTVSKHGERGRSHYRNAGNFPEPKTDPQGLSSTETDRGQIANLVGIGLCEKDYMNAIGHAGGQSGGSSGMPHNYMKPQVTNLSDNDKNHPEEIEMHHKNYSSPSDKSMSASYCVTNSTNSPHGSFLDMLTSHFSQSIGRETSTDLTNRLDELLLNSKARQYSPNPICNDSESIKALLRSFIQKLLPSKDGQMPSLDSYLLLQNLSQGKHSTAELLRSLMPDFGGMSATDHNEQMTMLLAQCCDSSCTVIKCLEVQERLMTLKDNKTTIEELSEELKLFLWHLYEHCCCCQRLHCPLPWCQKEADKWNCDENDKNKILGKMKRLVEHGYHGNFLEEVKSGSFSKFVSDLPLDYLPKEGVDFYGICRMPEANNSILAMSDHDEHSEYWVIKKSRMFKSGSQTDLYEKLRQISDNGIAQHLWTVFCPSTNYMAVCTSFEAISLHEWLQSSPMKDLHAVVRLMIQIINTMHHLHDKGILYLNWSSKNILFLHDRPEQFKLTNFTCSALISSLPNDIDQIIKSLPRHLCAPEMLQTNPEINESTDIWGLGCILHEMCSGLPVWHEYQHEPDKVLFKKIFEERPRQGHECLDLFKIFKGCWERDGSCRPNHEQFQDLLVDAESNHRSRRS